jgi:hypothetical protein
MTPQEFKEYFEERDVYYGIIEHFQLFVHQERAKRMTQSSLQKEVSNKVSNVLGK